MMTPAERREFIKEELTSEERLASLSDEGFKKLSPEVRAELLRRLQEDANHTNPQ